MPAGVRLKPILAMMSKLRIESGSVTKRCNAMNGDMKHLAVAATGRRSLDLKKKSSKALVPES